MARRSAALLGALGIVFMLGGALAGCASSSGTVPTEDPAETLDTELDAAWLDGGRMAGLVTDGLVGIQDVQLTLTGPAGESFTTTVLGVNAG